MLILAVIAFAVALAALILFLQAKSDQRRRWYLLIAAAVWAAYGVYEGIYIREWLTTVRGAPIRVDLVPIGILLAVASIKAFRVFDEPASDLTNTPKPLDNEGIKLPGTRRCHSCGYVGPMKTWLRHYNAPQFLALLLLSLMLVPGIVFLGWYWGKFKCPRCNKVGKNSAA